MLWCLSYRADPRALPLADRHYSRRAPGTRQFVAPGRPVVLLTPEADALWVSLWQRPDLVKHRWPGAWLCSLFRNESKYLSSDLIRDAIAATLHRWGAAPPTGMVTFIDRTKTRPKRDPGRCFRRAGFLPCGFTAGGLFVLQLPPSQMPSPCPARIPSP